MAQKDKISRRDLIKTGAVAGAADQAMGQSAPAVSADPAQPPPIISAAPLITDAPSLETAQFAAALETALGAGTSALIELRIDAEAINPRTTLTRLREDAQR